MKSPRVLMIFLDGFGIGKKNSSVNPFFSASLPTLQKLLEGNIPYLRSKKFNSNGTAVSSLNATLGVEGLPQSGTGQTALFCGVNAPQIIGKHFGPYPYSTLKKVISQKNIFIKLKQKRKKVFYVNAYPPRYFEYMENHQSRRTVTTLAWLLSGNNLNDHHKLKNGLALSSDITNQRWNSMGFPSMPELTPFNAGKRLVSFLDHYDFVMYEYFFTDHAGHSQSMEKAKEELEKIDGLIGGVMEEFDKKRMLLVLTSDHGNIEDLSTKSHTRNPVPLFLVGNEQKRKVFQPVKNITQISSAILNILG
ncbi:MAG: alkaline phosphatase family protein [Bacteroidota bacterium]|nr:alkaline phosphatase family protein [Bacteroidota bacterium]